MALTLPASLKAADIQRFVTRGSQVERTKPAIAYWCYYRALQPIIANELQKTDGESLTYTLKLMEKVEQVKKEHAQDDAIVDDTVAQAYIEQFANEVFQRADNTMGANKVTAQTADTLMAAATFLDVLSALGPLEPEIASKVKFAKYHALRILKALKQGQDPNLTNPAPEADPAVEQDAIADEPRQQSWQPSVEDAPDEHDGAEHHLSPLDQTLHRPIASPIPRPAAPTPNTASEAVPPHDEAPLEDFYKAPAGGDVSPLDSESVNEVPKPVEYFPQMPADASDGPGAILPSVPSVNAAESPRIPSPSRLPPRQSIDHSNPNVQNFPPNPPISPEQGLPPRLGGAGFPSPSPALFQGQPAWQPPPPSVPQVNRPVPAAQPRPPPPQAAQPIVYNTDDQSVTRAQKHCKWAISALNFEDSATAVNELRAALEALGAT